MLLVLLEWSVNEGDQLGWWQRAGHHRLCQTGIDIFGKQEDLGSWRKRWGKELCVFYVSSIFFVSANLKLLTNLSLPPLSSNIKNIIWEEVV